MAGIGCGCGYTKTFAIDPAVYCESLTLHTKKHCIGIGICDLSMNGANLFIAKLYYNLFNGIAAAYCLPRGVLCV